MLILVLNSGSSSLKYQLYDMPQERCLAKGNVEKIGADYSLLTCSANSQKTLRGKVKVADHKAALKLVIQYLQDERLGVISSVEQINAVGHRVVHGGEKFKRSALINAEILKAIKRYSQLAPLHNPSNLTGIYACKRLLPHLPQVAVFDTAFHQTMPVYAYLYGLPYTMYEKYRVRRYGFHGTSHRYAAERAAELLDKPLSSLKVITCHLGNGCSVTAVDKGKSVDTSMGFTPLEGLVMGTRCGDIDAAVVLYLMKKRNLSIEEMDTLLNKQSGLLGLSGGSNDMRDIRALIGKGSRRAKEALAVFVYRIKKYIGAYIAAMNGCDAVIFTAGIGENNPAIRKQICRGISSLIERFNVRVLVIPANEELMIARDTYKIVQ